MKFAFPNIFKVVVFFFLASCNHYFYYPDAKFYYDPESLGLSYNTYEWTHKDSLALKVLEILPQSEEKATILHFHGNAQNRSAHFVFSHWFAKYGYRIIVPDYRGYGGSDGEPSREGLYEDAKLFLEKTCSQGDKPVFIFAQSLGGAVVTPALAESPKDCVCGLIIESSFPSYRDIARDKLGSFWFTWAFQYPLSYLISDSRSPKDYAERISIPALFIHGTEDPIVPYKFGKAYFDLIASKDKEFWTVEGGIHTPAFADEKSPYIEKVVEWMQQRAFLCKGSYKALN